MARVGLPTQVLADQFYLNQRDQIDEFSISENVDCNTVATVGDMIQFYMFLKIISGKLTKDVCKYYSNFLTWAGKAHQIQILVISKSKQKKY